jgi:hypothetical protein
MDMVFIHAGYGADVDSDYKTRLTALSAAIFAAFIALWWFAKAKPRLCLGLGLAVFWGVHLVAAIDDSPSLFRGILIKFFFTVAPVRGLRSAGRAQDLRAHLGEVFE